MRAERADRFPLHGALRSTAQPSCADADAEAELKPVVHEEGLTYTYITHNSLYLLAVSRANVNAVATLYFLHRLVDVFKYYFEARRFAIGAHRSVHAC